jgi:hypothetical protein
MLGNRCKFACPEVANGHLWLNRNRSRRMLIGHRKRFCEGEHAMPPGIATPYRRAQTATSPRSSCGRDRRGDPSRPNRRRRRRSWCGKRRGEGGVGDEAVCRSQFLLPTHAGLSPSGASYGRSGFDQRRYVRGLTRFEPTPQHRRLHGAGESGPTSWSVQIFNSGPRWASLPP